MNRTSPHNGGMHGMKREIGWAQITRDPDTVLTVGTFDGVHRGHQAILRYLLERADMRDGTSTVISFDPHPREVVGNESVPLLTTVDERAQLFEQFGLDRFVVIPFTHEFRQVRATEYVEDILLGRVGLKEIVIGYDHAFGKDREGDRELLERMGEAHGFSVDVIPAQAVDHDVVSSSKIRTLLAEEGDVARANELLGHRYALSGQVERGEGRGRKIGYPTANMDVLDDRKLVPKIGVYAIRVRIGDGSQTYDAMMNIGRRPTFDGMDVTVEAHLFGFDGNLYGETLRVEFLRRLRDEQKFDSVDALVMQLSEDEAHCKRVIEALD